MGEVTIPKLLLTETPAGEDRKNLLNTNGYVELTFTPDHEYTFSDWLALKEAKADAGPYVSPGPVHFEEDARKQLAVKDSFAQLESFAADLESVALACPSCSAPLKDNIRHCPSCRAIVTWHTQNELVNSLQVQLFNWEKHAHILRLRQEALGFNTTVGDFNAAETVTLEMERTKKLLDLTVKALKYTDPEHAPTPEGLGCPSCGGPLGTPTYCDYCHSAVVYTDLSLTDLTKLDDTQLQLLAEEQEQQLISALYNVNSFQKKLALAGGLIHIQLEDFAEMERWKHELERARAMCTNIAYVRGRDKDLDYIDYEVKHRMRKHGTIKNYNPVEAKAMVPRCVNCAAPTQTLLEDTTDLKPDFCNCANCKAPSSYGSAETTNNFLESYASGIRTEYAALERTLAIQIRQYFMHEDKDRYLEQPIGQSFLMVAQNYMDLFASGNTFLESLGKRKHQQEVKLALNPDILKAMARVKLPPLQAELYAYHLGQLPVEAPPAPRKDPSEPFYDDGPIARLKRFLRR